MKRVIYKGLLALTIAFGFTSCDKNDVGSENLQMTQSEVKAGLASKVTFSETGVGISVPKLKGSESSKTHLEFTHIYSPARQVLSIVNAGNVEQYTGSYAANDISTINPTSILLENGVGYTATSSNVSNTGLGVVSPFLPYTSTVVFDLSESGQIVLAATLERGFLIVNGAAEALAGNRISGVTAKGVDLIRDNDGDFYGYLSAGVHEIIISYTRDGASATTVDSIDVAIGTAYTVETGLLDESPDVVDSTVSTSTGTGLESEIGQTEGGRDINDDGDKFDSLERIVTSTQATLNGDNVGDAVDTYGSWSVVSDLDVDVDVSSEESTEADYESSVNADGDLFDTIIRVVTTTTTSVNDVVTDTDIDNGDWTILADHSELTVGQSGTGTGDAVNGVDTFSVWSAWSPENDADTTVAEIVQTRTRTIVFVDAEDVPAPAGALSQTQTVDNPLYVIPAVTYDVREYSAWSPLTAAADVAIIFQARTLTNVDGSFDPAIAIGLLERNIANTAYVADEADLFVYGDYTGTGTAPAAAPEYGTWVTQGASDSSIATLTQTRSVVNVTAAYSYEQTRTVEILIVVREDATPLDLSDAITSQMISVPAVRDAQDDATQMIANPNYEEPSDEAATGVVTLLNTGVGTLPQFAAITIDGEASGAELAAGTYDIVVTPVTGPAVTIEVTITADDISDNAVTFSVNTNTYIATKS